MPDCPAVEEPGRCLFDELPADANRAAEAHVETRPACRQSLEALSGEWLTERMPAAGKPRR